MAMVMGMVTSNVQVDVQNDDLKNLARHLSKQFSEEICPTDIEITQSRSGRGKYESYKSSPFKIGIGREIEKQKLFMKQSLTPYRTDIIEGVYAEDITKEAKVLEILSQYSQDRNYNFPDGQDVKIFPDYYGLIDFMRKPAILMEYIGSYTLEELASQVIERNDLAGLKKAIQKAMNPLVLLHVLPTVRIEINGAKVQYPGFRPTVKERLSEYTVFRRSEDYADHFIRYLEILSEKKPFEWKDPDVIALRGAFIEFYEELFAQQEQVVTHGDSFSYHLTSKCALDASRVRISAPSLDITHAICDPDIFMAFYKNGKVDELFTAVTEEFTEKVKYAVNKFVDPYRLRLHDTNHTKDDRRSVEEERFKLANRALFYPSLKKIAALIYFTYPNLTHDDVINDVNKYKEAAEKQFEIFYDSFSDPKRIYLNVMKRAFKNMEVFDITRRYQFN